MTIEKSGAGDIPVSTVMLGRPKAVPRIHDFPF